MTTTRNQYLWGESDNIQPLASSIDSGTVENLHSSDRPVQSEERNDRLAGENVH